MKKSRLAISIGCFGLAVLGICLAVPVRAQDAAKQKEGKGIVIQIDGKQGLILIPGRAADQEVMELLQKALRILARKSQTQPGKLSESDKIKNAKEQVEALRRQKELVEAKLRQAQARLAQLQGKPAGVFQFEIQLDPKKGPAAKGKGIGIFNQELELRIQDGKIIRLLPQKNEKEMQRQELLNRLNQLMREIEELRKDFERRNK